MASVFGAGDNEQIAKKQESMLAGQQQSISTEQHQTISSGIPGFDESLGQGLSTGNIYLLTGTVGAGIEQFAQQVLYTTLITKSKITYYNLENSSSDIVQDMKEYGMNIQPYVDDGSWKFARVIPQNMKKVIEAFPEEPMEERIYLDESFTGLMNHFYDSVKNKRNTVLHLTSLARNYSLEEIQNLLTYMKGMARGFGGIHFLILTHDAIPQTTAVTIKDIADTVFDTETAFRGNEVENTISITKIRNMIPKTRKIRLTQRETGLFTETIRRIQ